MFEEHLRFLPHGLPQVVGELEFARPPGGVKESRVNFLQLVLLLSRQALRRFAVELPEPSPLAIHLGIPRLVMEDHHRRVD
jgi:hypothetical protein